MNILGKWKSLGQTPFGVVEHVVEITAVDPHICGIISSNNGQVEFDNGTLEGNKISFSSKVITPLRATIFVDGIIDGNIINGIISVDEYMKINFKAEKI